MYRDACRVAAVVAVLGLPGLAAAQSHTVFNFNGDLSPGPTVGTAAGLSYFNGATTQNAVSFGSTAGFGAAALPGDPSGTRTVMSFPAFASNQGLQLAPNVAPNGGSNPGYVNRYSMGFDLYLTGENWFSFFQTNAANVNDGEFFRRATAEGGGIGISGAYDGSLPSNQWHRVVFTFDMPEGGTPTLKKYIDGALVGTQTLGDGYEGRWALYANSGPDPQNVAYILADESGDTTPGLIASYYFTDSVLTDAQVLALGGPTAGGFVPVPEPAGMTGLGFVVVGLLRLVRRRRRRD